MQVSLHSLRSSALWVCVWTRRQFICGVLTQKLKFGTHLKWPPNCKLNTILLIVADGAWGVAYRSI